MASKRKLIGILIPCLGLGLGLGVGVKVQAHTLSEAVKTTIESGPDMLIEANNRNAVDFQLRESYAGYLPTLDLNLGYGREYSKNTTTIGLANRDDRTLTRRELSLTMSQMLFDGFSVSSEVDRNKARVEGAAYRVNGTAQDVAMQVAESYLQVLTQRRLVHLGKQNLSAHQEIYKQIKKRSDSGIGRKADLDQAASRLALARTNLLAVQANLRDAETTYTRLVGIAPKGLQWPASPSKALPKTEQAAVSVALAGHPTFKAAMADVDSAKSQYDVARAGYFPRLDLELGLTRNKNLDGSTAVNNDTTAMLRLRYNIYRGGADTARVRETAWQIQEAAEVRNRARRQVVENVKLAWSGFTTARSQLGFFQKQVEANERTRDAYQKQFNIGQRTLLDLLDSENELFSSRSAKANAEFTALFGKLRVLNAVGSLTDYLGVALPSEAQQKDQGLWVGVGIKPPHKNYEPAPYVDKTHDHAHHEIL